MPSAQSFKRLSKLTCLGTLLVALLLGCGFHGEVASENGRSESIERDRRPIEERYPEFGEFEKVEWGQEIIKNPKTGMSDFRTSGIVQLDEDGAKRLRDSFSWNKEEGDPDVISVVRGRLPINAEWSSSAKFAEGVTLNSLYYGKFSVDFAKRLLVFDTVNAKLKPYVSEGSS